MIAAIYARKSNPQEGVAGTSESVDRQIAHSRAYAVGKGWTVAEGHIYYDDKVSGATWARLDQRNRLVEVCEAGAPFQALIVSEQFRLGRHMIETAYTIMRIADSGVRIYSYLDDREISVEDEVDQAMTVLQSFAGAVERRQTSKRVFDSAIRRVRAGQVAGAKVYGYDHAHVKGASGKRLHTLRRPNPEQAAVIRRIFDRYAEGIGSLTIARELNAEGVPAPRAPAGWHQTAIRQMLQNPIYRGEVVWGRVKTVVRKGKERNERRPESEWIRLEAPELRLVSDELWTRAQARRQERRETIPRSPLSGKLLGRPTWRDGHSDYLLTGFAACALCGGSIRTLTLKYGRRPRRYPVRFYVCAESQNRGAAVCRNEVRVRQDLLDHAVIQALGELLDERLVDAAVDRALERLRAGEARMVDQRTQIERELSLIEHRIQRGLDAYLNGEGPMEELRVRLGADKARKTALAGQLEALALRSPGEVDRARLRQRAADVRALLGRHTPQARQMLRRILAEPIRMTPMVQGPRKGLRFEGRLAFDWLLGGVALRTPRAGTTAAGTCAGARGPGPSGSGCRPTG
jgi:site-specific DNA recombinase